MGAFPLLGGGALLSAPPARGELKTALESLAAKTWTHPVTGREVRFAAKTLERWLYRARQERDDPVGALHKAVRKDCGKVSLKPELIECLANQYHDYPHWTYQLHYDNLQARVKGDAQLGPLRSYSTVRRYMVAQGLVRKPRLKPKKHPGEWVAALRRERREIRSYETQYVGALWHLDFHHGSLRVVTARGQWQRPLALGILDDHSRYCVHLQWYLSETTEDLVHGFSQGIQKCGLPRAAMSDNGSAMLADEFTEGLLRLGILHETTLPFSAYQNGKQESFWAHLEGRLLEMLGKVRELTLDFLNEATQAWVEIEYNRRVHRETGCAPAARLATAPDVLRPSPSSDALRGVSPGSETASASKRRHDLSGRRAAGDPEPLSSLSRRGSALSALGPQLGGSGGPARARSWPACFPWIGLPMPTGGAGGPAAAGGDDERRCGIVR